MKKINIVDILSKKSNNSYRTVTDNTNPKYVFDNQITAAKEIVSELAKKTTRSHHVLLLAKMQSGKTGVCNSVINILTQTKLNVFMGIDKYMFVTGMNDCGLKEQTYTRLIEQVIGANKDNTYIGKRSKKNLSPNQFFIMKNSDLLKYDDDINNTILFIDESHYGSNERNILTQFLVKYGINWKNPIELIKRNIYIVSVSATPFDEIVSDKAECKKMVELKTDDSYVGVTEYLHNDLIFDAEKDDVKDGTIMEYVDDALERMNNNHESGFIFIRTRDFVTLTENSTISNTFDIVELKSTTKAIDYQNLYEKMEKIVEENEFNKRMLNMKLSNGRKPTLIPIKPLLILLKGAFRAGITIPSSYKDYIYMIYDYSLKADTTAQALLGRICGYRPTNDEDFKNTYIYINKKFADMYSDWENDFQNREAIPYNKSSWVWVDESYNGATTVASKSCGNFAIDLSEDEIKSIYNVLYRKRNKLAIMEEIFPQILKEKDIEVPYDYMEEVLMGGKNNYKSSSQRRRFDGFTKDLLVYPFRAEKIKKFYEDTNRDYLTKEDLGKKCVSLVLDAEVYTTAEGLLIKGNKRLLVYYSEVAQKALMANRDSMYKPHKDTTLIKKK